MSSENQTPTPPPAAAEPNPLGATPSSDAGEPLELVPRDVVTPEPNPAETAASATDAGEPTSTLVEATPSDASNAAPSVAPGAGAEEGDDGEEEEEGEESASAEARGDGSAETAPDGTRPKRKRKRRKKKTIPPEGHEGAHRSVRPSTERAPFHVGEEVFGKVTAVLDEAVMIDLSGKALAIFDRSEMDPDDLVPSVGDRFVARVHNDGARAGLVVLTRKPLREEETKPRLEKAEQEGTFVSGLVIGAVKGGVEVDIGGVRAFAPASGMDLHPAQANFQGLVGLRLEFKVLQYKSHGRDVVVTRRPMLEAEAHERRKIALTQLTEGQVMKGVVRTVVEWGAFVALPEAENLEGLVHVSEASHDPRPDLLELFKPGAEVEVKITKIDDKGKIWLSRKALVEDPWADARQKYPQGEAIKGKVTRLESFGAFVEIEEGLEGLLHVADLAFDRIEHPNEVLKEGQEIEVFIHHFDQRAKKMSLHLAPPPERRGEDPQRVVRGANVRAEVVKVESSGVVCRVLGLTGRGARGFLPAGQTGTPRGTDLRKHFKQGEVIEVKVLDLDPRRGEPKLSVRGLREDEERRAHAEYRKKLKAESSFGTLGDLLAKRFGQSKPEE
ncbi:MAG: 30S ribosomal protein S1 [Polyangiaceae bacterium]|nr:30S ribosomal protein S1 [Polyangiaceae bacterium]